MPEKRSPKVTTRYWGPGKDPAVDPPDSEKVSSSLPNVQVIDPMAAKAAQDVLNAGGTMEEAKKAAVEYILRKRREAVIGPGSASALRGKWK